MIKGKRMKKEELCRDIQSTDMKRIASFRSTTVVSNVIETKGMLINTQDVN